MVEYAEAVFLDEAPAPGGATKGAHIRQAQMSAAALGITWLDDRFPAAADPMDPPFEWEGLWEMFRELSAARTSGFSPNPLSWTDIRSYCELLDIRLTGFDLMVIRRLDLTWLRVMGAAYNDLNTTEPDHQLPAG